MRARHAMDDLYRLPESIGRLKRVALVEKCDLISGDLASRFTGHGELYGRKTLLCCRPYMHTSVFILERHFEPFNTFKERQTLC